jgi:hypothetical protein
MCALLRVVETDLQRAGSRRPWISAFPLDQRHQAADSVLALLLCEVLPTAPKPGSGVEGEIANAD